MRGKKENGRRKSRKRKRKREKGNEEKRSLISSLSSYFRFPTRRCKVFHIFLSLNLVSVAASSSSFWVSAGVTVAGLANSVSGSNTRRTNGKLV